MRRGSYVEFSLLRFYRSWKEFYIEVAAIEIGEYKGAFISFEQFVGHKTFDIFYIKGLLRWWHARGR